MAFKWMYYITFLSLLSCYSSILPNAALSASSTVNDTNDLDTANTSITLDNSNQTQTSPNQIDSITSNKSTSADILLHKAESSDQGMENHKAIASPYANGTPSIDLPEDDEDPSSQTNLTSTGNLTKLNVYNSTHYAIWQNLISFPSYVICQFYQGSDYITKDVKTYFGGHKLLAMFLGMAGVLACLLILIYCIYIRQHKEEMFSHHRLYGEGFEDPVLHLDTPVDHLDFFSFRDTELTPAPTPQHKCHQTESYDTKGNYKVEAPKGTSSNELLQQIIQMGSIKQT